MNKLKLVPLYTPQAIIQAWGVISEGLEEVLKYSNGDTSMEKVFNEVMAGQLIVWVGFIDKKYIGFCTIRHDTPFGAEKYVSIIHLYVKPEVERDWWIQGLEEIEDYTKRIGFDAIRFWTIRDKVFERKLKEYGWKSGYVEFRKYPEKEKE